MQYIALTGAIGHGKTTVSDMLQAQLPHAVALETSHVIAETVDELHARLPENDAPTTTDDLRRWINNLPAILTKLIGTTVDISRLEFSQRDIDADPAMFVKLEQHAQALIADPDLARNRITRENKESYRPILQWVGGFVAKRVDSGFWFEVLIQRAERAATNGAEYCIMNAIRFPAEVPTVKHVNAHILKVERPALGTSDINDVTERETKLVKADTTIINDSDLAALGAAVTKFVADYTSGTIKSSYASSACKL